MMSNYRRETLTRLSSLALFIAMAVSGAFVAACGGAAPRADLKPLKIAEEGEKNPFARDKSGQISEADLAARLADGAVFLEDSNRVGILPVTVAYETDKDLPLAVVPQQLGHSLEDTGHFEVASEMSTDWPANGSVAGLRELAARYHTRYLLLYRHRFVDYEYTNGWGWSYLTLVAIPFVPSQTIELAGVLEATMFDARTGTIMFTVYERVNHVEDFNVWHNDRKRRKMKEMLLDQAAEKLASRVVGKVDRLVAARPAPEPAQPEVQPAAAPDPKAPEPATDPVVSEVTPERLD